MNNYNPTELVQKINSTDTSQILDSDGAYIAVVSNMRGVAIECDEKTIVNEKFNTIKLKNLDVYINGVQKKVVYLFVENGEPVSHIFGAMAFHFLKKENRETIRKDPFSWFDEWRTMVGETKKSKMIYDVIGEMSILLYLQEKGKKPSWDSINKGTFDITTNSEIYEVKTTQYKYNDCITIHSQFQLDYKKANKPVYIAFVKLEANNTGESIQSLFDKLLSAGYPKEPMSSYLDSNGYYEGKADRNRQYLIHEIRLYCVDDDFPKITSESFVDSKIPNGIVKYEYVVSLTGLKYTKII